MNVVSISSVGSSLVLVMEREKSQQQPTLSGPHTILLTPLHVPPEMGPELPELEGRAHPGFTQG